MTFWKQARGDHILVAALVTAMVLSWSIGIIYFGSNATGVYFSFFGSIWGFLLPSMYVSEFKRDWINNDLPKYHFWRDLIS